MAVPRAVKEQAAHADELARQAIENRNAQEGASVDEILATVDDNEPQNGQDGPNATPSDTDPQARNRETQEESTELKETRESLDALQQRHAALTGKYNKEVPRLLEEKRQLQERITVLERDLKAAQEAHPEPDDEDINKLKKKLGEEFSEDYVEQFSELTEAIARKSAPKMDTSANETRLEELQRQVDEMKATKVDDQLDMMVQGWQSIQQSPEFQKLLGSPVPRTSGRLIYDDLLKQWYQNGEVAPIVQFFNQFLNEQHRQPDNRAASADVHVEPDSGSGSPPPPPPKAGDQKVWKVSEIERINDLARQGAFKKRKAELAKLREQIERAASEGRIQHDMT